jgi:hypothetical protein
MQAFAFLELSHLDLDFLGGLLNGNEACMAPKLTEKPLAELNVIFCKDSRWTIQDWHQGGLQHSELLPLLKSRGMNAHELAVAPTGDYGFKLSLNLFRSKFGAVRTPPLCVG